MAVKCRLQTLQIVASMGPPSDNRGYVIERRHCGMMSCRLQWVHGRITVVMVYLSSTPAAQVAASMGPRSDNRGYAPVRPDRSGAGRASMGPRSDNGGYVRRISRCIIVEYGVASMGPRSDNRGYGR